MAQAIILMLCMAYPVACVAAWMLTGEPGKLLVAIGWLMGVVVTLAFR